VSDARCDLLCIDAPRAEVIRGALPSDEAAREAAREAADRARALSDPTRLVVAVALREGGELCVCDLAWISSRAQNLVSHHLRVLRSYGLVSSRRDGKMVMYALVALWLAVLADMGTSIAVTHNGLRLFKRGYV
jgi:ArsR family transcriptional regulator, lead/cadmium/zinc/bismuth-responsive transcriptional repressor